MGAVGWVIVGGESGQNARACEVAWVRSIRDQCRAAGVPVFVKQLGTSPYFLDSHGGDPEEWEEDLRVREFPA
jgi:protein gp37